VCARTHTHMHTFRKQNHKYQPTHTMARILRSFVTDSTIFFRTSSALVSTLMAKVSPARSSSSSSNNKQQQQQQPAAINHQK
jgi:hypothetical protein